MVVLGAGAASVGVYLHHESVSRARAEALLELGFAERDLAEVRAAATELADAELLTFTVGRQFDGAGEVGFYEAHRLDANQWSGTKVVLATTQAALDRNRHVDPRGGVTYQLRVLDKGKQPVTMTNRNAFREWTTTEYFTHYQVVTVDDLSRAKAAVLEATARYERARLALANAKYIWESAPEVGELAPTPPSEPLPSSSTHGEPSKARTLPAGPRIVDVEVCGVASTVMLWPPSGEAGGPFTIVPGVRVGPIAKGTMPKPEDLRVLGYVAEQGDGVLYWWQRLGGSDDVEAQIRRSLSGCHGGSADGRVERFVAGLSIRVADERFRTVDGHGVGTSFSAARRAMCPGGCALDDDVEDWDASFEDNDDVTVSRAGDDVIRELEVFLRN